ncbi:MAG: OmpA family protein [Actinomycetales bacterium]|nr:MAG: OmpA family protein [Actinomycetales bacterium]
MTPSAASNPIKIGVVYFTRSTYALDHNAFVALADILISLKSMKNRTITITGFTDITKGLDNSVISKARADTVRDYLLKNRIVGKFVVKGDGSTQLVAAGRSNDPLNRRVEIWSMPNIS